MGSLPLSHQGSPTCVYHVPRTYLRILHTLPHLIITPTLQGEHSFYAPFISEETKMRWQEYTEELYKKEVHSPDDHDGVITHLEPECQVVLRKHHYEQNYWK